MSVVENLVILYAGILLINIAISAILWIHDKEPLYRSVFFLWLTCVLSLVSQGMSTQNNLMIAIGFTPTFLINISLSYLLTRITAINVPWKSFFFLLLISYPAAVLFDFFRFPFTIITLPVVIAVSFPALYTGIKILYTKWKEISISMRALSLFTCILGVHNIDFAFLRMVESFAPMGFSIVIIIIFGLSIFAPAVVLEAVKNQQTILKEIDRLKSRFFANISHEFRTPLTLMIGPAEQMLSGEFKGDVKEQYRLILRNGQRLLRLINQLLDISKLESGRMVLQASETDIVVFLKKMVSVFESLAVRKEITLHFRAPEEPLMVFFDRKQ
jgi:signal transduction histidine kinase